MAAEVTASVEPDDSLKKYMPIIGAEIVLAVPKDGMEMLVRSSPGLRVHGYVALRERLGVSASINYIRGLNQTAVSDMTATDVYGLAAGARLVLSKSASHTLFAEGMLDIEHLSVDVEGGEGFSGTGLGLRFAIGAEVALQGEWHATATLAYTSTGVDIDTMDGATTTIGVDFVVLGMGAAARF